MKLKKMMIILFLILSVIPLTILGIMNVSYYYRKLNQIVENDLQVATSTQIKAIENFYEERVADANVFCNSLLVTKCLKGDVGPSDRLYLSAEDLLRTRVANNRFVESVTVLDPSYRIVLSSVDGVSGEKSELSECDPAYFGGDLRFTGVIELERPDGPRRIVAAVREIREGGRLLGYLVMELNLKFFEEVRVSASLFNNGTIYLLDGDERIITAGDVNESRDDFVLTKEERADYLRSWTKQDLDSRQGILNYRARGDRYISCYARLRHMDWMMISSINFDQVIQARQGVLSVCALILLELAALLFAVRLVFSRGLGKPVYRMLEKFHRIRETQDYRIRMDENEDSEIGIISKETNLLLASIAEYIQQEEQRKKGLLEQAQRDPLTGLYNRAAFIERLSEKLEGSAPGRQILCVYLDVDDFKSFNTKFGHDGGDRVLQFIGERLNAVSNGLAGRLGGDEFAACLTGGARAEFEEKLSGLLETINRGVLLRDGEERVRVYCSIGGSLADGDETGDELIKRADEAMYRVKFRDKNGYLIQSSNDRKKDAP